MPLQHNFRDESAPQQLIEVKAPLIRGAVPFKSAARKMVKPEGLQLSAQRLNMRPPLFVADRQAPLILDHRDMGPYTGYSDEP